VDNSLQISAGSFSFTGMKKFALLAAPLLFLSALVGVPPSAAAAVCEEGNCVETFQFTGATIIWQVPANATNLRFDVYGAQGGRSGGQGGRITGAFGSVPQQLYINVGGQGQQGSHRPGGFNGGGSSGGNHSDEGSGGGASDIRIGPALTDRIIVAGGGGGTGGWSGAGGGAGGGLQGQNGFNGQGGGGGGGSQTAGGSPGFTNGGSIGTAGSFGVGGTGGSSQSAGGGGGGGGWYGGGGGGPDIDTCCLDGGGGGGGSSYSYGQATEVQHQQGVRSGHGLVVISYQLPPSVVSFSGVQQQQNAVFSLVFNEPVTGLAPTDFEIVSGHCGAIEVFGSEASYQISVQDCQQPLVTLRLAANSVTSSAPGPTVAVSADVELDLTPPQLAWLFESYQTEAPATVTLEYSGAELLAGESDFSVSGCEGFDLENLPGQILITLADCTEGEVLLSLAANSFADEHGNFAPTETLVASFVLDLTDPAVSWEAGSISFLDEGAAVIVTASFSEPVSYELDAAVQVSGDAECDWSAETSATAVQFSFYGCSLGTLDISWQPQSLVDQAGRIGPAELSAFAIEIAEPVVELPVEIPVDAPAAVVVEQPAETPVATPVEAPAETPAATPQPAPTNGSTDSVDLVAEPVAAPVASPAASESQVDSEPQQPPASDEPLRPAVVVDEVPSDSGDSTEPQPGQQPEPAAAVATPAPTSVSDELQAEPALAPGGEQLEFAVSAERTEVAPVLIGAGVLAAGAALGAVLLLRRRLG
jgi:hypothetical protein